MKALLFTLLYTLLVAATPAFASDASLKITIDLRGANVSLCDDIAHPLGEISSRRLFPMGVNASEVILVIRNGSISTDGCKINTHTDLNSSTLHKHPTNLPQGHSDSVNFYRLNLVDIDLHIEAGDYVSAFYSTGMVVTSDEHTELEIHKNWRSKNGFDWNVDNSSPPIFED